MGRLTRLALDSVTDARIDLLTDFVGRPKIDARTSGVYWRAEPEDMNVLDGRDDEKRGELIAERLRQWKSTKA